MKTQVYLAQKPLRTSYEITPALATITDHARTGGTALDDPFRTRVEPMDGCHRTVLCCAANDQGAAHCRDHFY